MTAISRLLSLGSCCGTTSPFAALAGQPLPAAATPAPYGVPGATVDSVADRRAANDVRLCQLGEDGGAPAADELYWELSAEMDRADPVGALVATAARAVAKCADAGYDAATAHPLPASLHLLAPTLLSITITACVSNGEQQPSMQQLCTAMLKPLDDGKQQLAAPQYSMTLPMLEHMAAWKGDCTQPHPSCSFELSRSPTSSEWLGLQRFVQLLDSRLAAEQRHRAKQELEDSLDSLSEALTLGGSLDSLQSVASPSCQQLLTPMLSSRLASMEYADCEALPFWPASHMSCQT